ncbi:MAG TPA: alpha/beta hydrolase, partial [Acidimicrobiia bacterium]
CVLSISGRGMSGYDWALRHLAFGAAMAWEEISYGPEPDQVGDLRRPPIPGPHPVVVVVHGGFWEDQWRRDLMDGLSVAISEEGYATWNLEYRRVGPHGGWPTTLLDVAAGVDHLGGLDDLDLDRVTIVGHSAGGQLALWAAARGGFEDGAPGAHPSIGPAGVVAMAAVSDLEDAEKTGVGNGAVAAFLRGLADHRDKYRLASPIERLPLGVPQVIVHGGLDELVPVEMSRRYVDRARKAGDSVTYLELPDCDHMSLIDPSSTAWKRVAEHI